MIAACYPPPGLKSTFRSISKEECSWQDCSIQASQRVQSAKLGLSHNFCVMRFAGEFSPPKIVSEASFDLVRPYLGLQIMLKTSRLSSVRNMPLPVAYTSVKPYFCFGLQRATFCEDVLATLQMMLGRLVHSLRTTSRGD